MHAANDIAAGNYKYLIALRNHKGQSQTDKRFNNVYFKKIIEIRMSLKMWGKLNNYYI